MSGANKHAARAARLAAGLCPGCGGPKGDGWQCRSCEKKAQDQHRAWRERKRLYRQMLRSITLSARVSNGNVQLINPPPETVR